MAKDDADRTTMGNDQKIFAGIAHGELLPRFQDTVSKHRHGFTARRRMAFRVFPEAGDALPICRQQLLGSFSLPVTKMDFAQTVVDFDGQGEMLREVFREGATTNER